MIEFEDEKYGRIVIYEPGDLLRQADYPPLRMVDREQWTFENVSIKNYANASIIGFRDCKKRIVKVLKNRYAPLEDFETEQFILNYSPIKEVIDPIYTRFEILDL